MIVNSTMVFDIMDSDNRGIYDINALLRFNEKIEIIVAIIDSKTLER